MIVELEQALLFLGITNPTPEQEELIELFIDMVGAEIESYLGIHIVPTSITGEELNYPSDLDYSVVPKIEISEAPIYLRLNYSPVSNVVLKTRGNSVIPTSSYSVNSQTGLITLLEYCGDAFKADYTAGFNPVPADLQLVALQGIKQYYSESGTTSQGSGNVKSKSLDRFSVSYGNSNQMYASSGTGMKQYLAGNSAILKKYKSRRIYG